MTFANSCAAVAAGKGVVRWKPAETREEASDAAMKACGGGGNCEAEAWACSYP